MILDSCWIAKHADGRPTATVLDYGNGRYFYDEPRRYEMHVLTYDELMTFHPKYIFDKKQRGVSTMNADHYVAFKVPNNLPKDSLLKRGGYYAVSAGDYRKITYFITNKKRKILKFKN